MKCTCSEFNTRTERQSSNESTYSAGWSPKFWWARLSLLQNQVSWRAVLQLAMHPQYWFRGYTLQTTVASPVSTYQDSHVSDHFGLTGTVLQIWRSHSFCGQESCGRVCSAPMALLHVRALSSFSIEGDLSLYCCPVCSVNDCNLTEVFHRHNLLGSTNLMEAMRKHNVKTVSQTIILAIVFPYPWAFGCLTGQRCICWVVVTMHIYHAKVGILKGALLDKHSWLEKILEIWVIYRWFSVPHARYMVNHQKCPSMRPSPGKLLALTEIPS